MFGDKLRIGSELEVNPFPAVLTQAVGIGMQVLGTEAVKQCDI